MTHLIPLLLAVAPLYVPPPYVLPDASSTTTGGVRVPASACAAGEVADLTSVSPPTFACVTDQTAAGGGGHTIEEEGTPLTSRPVLNFVGPQVTVTDDAVGNETDVAISAAPPTSGTAILKGNGSGGFSSAASGTDYGPPTSALATGLLKNTTGTGAHTIATSGTDYAPATSGTSLLKGNGSGGFSAAVAGTDYLAGGWEYLGGTSMGSAAATSSTVTFSARTELMFVVDVSGYSGADIVSLRFGTGAGVDTGQNYTDRNVHSSVGGAGVTWVYTECSSTANTANCATATNRVRCRLASNPVATARLVRVLCTNNATRSKTCRIEQVASDGNASTADVSGFGSCEWVNTSAQMTQAQLHANGGANLNSGTQFVVFGRNAP